MKNKKFKLFASLTSLVMVVAVMAVGVWAATAGSIGVTGTASFTAQTGLAGTVAVSGATGNVKMKLNNKGTYQTFDELSNKQIAGFDLTNNSPITGSVDLQMSLSDSDTNGYITSADQSANVFTVTYTFTNNGPVAYTVTVGEIETLSGAQHITAEADKNSVQVAAKTTTEGEAPSQTITITYELVADNSHNGSELELNAPEVTFSIA